jgi:hypothetical protein
MTHETCFQKTSSLTGNQKLVEFTGWQEDFTGRQAGRQAGSRQDTGTSVVVAHPTTNFKLEPDHSQRRKADTRGIIIIYHLLLLVTAAKD